MLASLLSHNIGLPPVVALGSAALQQQVVPRCWRGARLPRLPLPSREVARTWPRTRARLDGGHYVIDGEKTFITSGMRADWLTVAVRTGEEKGAGGISLLLVPGDSPGLARSRLDKMGWQCSDTAHLFFEDVRVPASHLLGAEGEGFRAIMSNFNGERLGIACGALGFAQACYDEALSWAQQRKTFGVTLNQHQVIRHKLVDMQQRIRSTEAWLNAVAARADAGDTGADWVGEVCVLKNHATQTMQHCADTAVQILGGMGFMRGTVSERIYREVKVLTIGGGTEEIMKELAARQWQDLVKIGLKRFPIKRFQLLLRATMSDKAIITCSITGVLTDPEQHHVPVTPSSWRRKRAEPMTPGPPWSMCTFASRRRARGICRAGSPRLPRPVWMPCAQPVRI